MTECSLKDLKTWLLHVSKLWSEKNDGAPASRVSKRVTNDAARLDRIANGGGVNLSTLESFGGFFVDPDNWPEGVVPHEARQLAHRLGITAPDSAAPTGKLEGITQ